MLEELTVNQRKLKTSQAKIERSQQSIEQSLRNLPSRRVLRKVRSAVTRSP